MTGSERKCMVCAKAAPLLRGGICEACQEKIRREALGEQGLRKRRRQRGAAPAWCDTGKEVIAAALNAPRWKLVRSSKFLLRHSSELENFTFQVTNGMLKSGSKF